jgi:acetate kinase
MTDTILSLNAGSSSLKFALFASAADGLRQIGRGQIEPLTKHPRLTLKVDREILMDRELDIAETEDRRAILAAALAAISPAMPMGGPIAVGHRVVHGGVSHAGPAVIDTALRAELAQLAPLAPLHQLYNLAGINAATVAFPGARQIACFDTAFHRTQPWVADVFGLPRHFYQDGVRRYGFHGLSYQSIVQTVRQIAPKLAAGRLIVAHLGAGASMCAIRDGRSVGSTMGFSTLAGLPMGTRSGELDPGVLLWLMDERRMTTTEVTDLLYNRSGLLGLSELSDDIRDLEASNDPKAAEALAYFTYRIRREIGALAAILGGVDGLIFTGGIGENSARVRSTAVSGLDFLGITIDPEKNAAQTTMLSPEGAPVKVYRIATDEERIIAEATAALLQ